MNEFGREAYLKQRITYRDYKGILYEFLARIHRDGGHYTEKHGLLKSVMDADRIVAELVVK